jgi:hypothetical protein
MSTHRAARLQSAITELVDVLGEDISTRVVNSIAKEIASSPVP